MTAKYARLVDLRNKYLAIKNLCMRNKKNIDL